MNKPDSREAVVLLHGVALTRRFMQPLADHLEAAGFRTVNRSYPSRTSTFAQLASEWLPGMLSAFEVGAAPRVHFVAHSMGTLLVRHLMAHARPPNLGRVVLLCPPSRGSELADTGRPRWLFRAVVGINLGALGRGEEAFWRTLPHTADFSLGVIAGTARGNPFGAGLPKPNDGTVTVAETRIDGASDSIELPFPHTGLLRKRETADQVLGFLRHGCFVRTASNPV